MNEPRLCWKGVMLYLACTKWLILKGGLQEVVSWQSTSYSCWFCLPSSQGLGWRVPAAGIGGTAGLRAQGQKTNAFSLWRACSRSWYGDDVLEVTFFFIILLLLHAVLIKTFRAFQYWSVASCKNEAQWANVLHFIWWIMLLVCHLDSCYLSVAFLLPYSLCRRKAGFLSRCTSWPALFLLECP